MNPDIEKYDRVMPTMTKAIPIPIPRKTATYCPDNIIYYPQYDLKKNCFDPTKGSTPNSWTSRLMERIENYSTSATTSTNSTTLVFVSASISPLF